MPLNEFGQPVGSPIERWTTRPLPKRAILEGHRCRLEPIDTARHADALYAAYQEAPDGRDWTYMPVERPSGLPAYRDFVAAQASSDDPLHYAVVDRKSAAPLGTAALMRIDSRNGTAEVGHIAFSPRLQRTALGSEAIYLLMSHVFDDLRYRRFEWKCDSLNAPSRRAALRYGFSYEGIFRKAVVTKGRNRDTAWYAMVDDEWSLVKAAFQTWLADENFDANERQRRSLVVVRESLKAREIVGPV